MSVEIIVALEERFGIEFHTRELDALGNIGDFARVLAHKTQG
jgi:acyl carrier protein